MSAVFLYFVNISIVATWVILALVLLRPLLKKFPKWINCCLWGVVGLRLCLPFSFESVFSLIPSKETIPNDIAVSSNPQIDSGIGIINESINPVISDTVSFSSMYSANSLEAPLNILTIIWIAGILLMFLYSFVSFLYLKIKVLPSVKTEDKKNVRVCDNIKTPFILGVIKPKIYIPSGLSGEDLKFVLQHENSHIKRKDYAVKPLSFLVLAIYWFNPAIWLWYILLCRDIEAACDEKVIKEYDDDLKKQYSTALLNCSNTKRTVMACPVAFGEVGVKERINSVLKYKKPALLLVVASLVFSIVFVVCFATNPHYKKIENIINEKGYDVIYGDYTPVNMYFVAGNIVQYIPEEGKKNTPFLNTPLAATGGAQIYLDSVESFPESDEVYLTLSVSYSNLSDEGIVISLYKNGENGKEFFTRQGDKVNFCDVTGDSSQCEGEIVSVERDKRFVVKVKKSWLESRSNSKMSMTVNMGEIAYQSLKTQLEITEAERNVIENEIEKRVIKDDSEIGFPCIDYNIVNIEKTGDAATFYIWALYQEYYVSDTNGELALSKSKHLPIKLSLLEENGGYMVSEYWELSDEYTQNENLRCIFLRKNDAKIYLKMQTGKCLAKAKAHFNLTNVSVSEIVDLHDMNSGVSGSVNICDDSYIVSLSSIWSFDEGVATKNSHNKQIAQISKSQKTFNELYDEAKDVYKKSEAENVKWSESLGETEKYDVKNEFVFVEFKEDVIIVKIGFETEKGEVFEVFTEVSDDDNDCTEKEYLEFYNSVIIK